MQTSRVLIVIGLIACSLTASAQPRGAYSILAQPPGFDGPPDLLGVVVDGQFREGEEAARRVKGGESYRVASASGAFAQAKGGKPVSSGEPCATNYNVTLSPKPKADRWWIATTAPWNLRPRAVTALDAKNPTYVGVVRDYLEQVGLKDPDVQIKRIWRTDLEGDKQDEVIIVARKFSERDDPLYPPVNGQKGDYAVVLVRKIINGTLETIALDSDVVLQDADPNATEPQHIASQYDVPLVMDLNGDGRMELVEWDAYYEGYSISVLEWSGSQFRTMVSSGCGA